MKEWTCIEVGHHKNIPKTIEDMQKTGWRLHTYQTTVGHHYLLFEKGNNE